MKLDAEPLSLDGCYAARLTAFSDERGSFHKLFHRRAFQAFLPGFSPAEVYLTTSARNVLRGMHFQLPPHDHAKVVICLSGRLTDVLLDLRPGAGFGRSTRLALSTEGPNAVLIPKGIAHGFYAHENGSALLYLVETEYASEWDAGVMWDSFGFDWPSDEPVLSERDQRHPTLAAFRPPGEWTAGAPSRRSPMLT